MPGKVLSPTSVRAARQTAPLAPLALTLGALLYAAISPPLAAAATASSPCLNTPGFSCTNLNVPLDRTGRLAGTVTLAIERLQAGATPSEDAVVALAGGPGQAAIPIAQAAAHMISPALGSRDLVVFDQRGTGNSGPLSCRALEGSPPTSATVGRLFELCALQIGPRRGSYTTEESVADIEAIRQAFGYRRLVLFGVSYGTKVALQYAERHPGNVEALVLDSVVPTAHADPFSTAMFAAIGPALNELCSADGCAGITSDPVADMARLTSRLARHALKGYVYDGHGHRHAISLSDVDLLNLVGAGDLNPALRALLPAAVQSALRGDPSPLLRLNLLSEGLIPNVPVDSARLTAASRRPALAPPVPGSATHATTSASQEPPAFASGGVDETLFVDTTCEEAPFPWQRSASPAMRTSEALAALRALPAAAFYPFSAAVEWEDSVLPGCAHWPNVAPAPPPAGPLPDVPTLLLSGAQDMRTPTSNARLIAQRIPGAQLVVVPYTGHSVLGSDFSGCAQAAVKAFFAGAAVQPCASREDPFTPTPIAPTRLESVKPVGGVPGRPGSTLAVVLDTIVDLERQVIGAMLQAEQALPSGSSFGGLHGGYAQLSSSALHLRGLSFVPGVQLTGTFPIHNGKLVRSTLRVEGSAAASGDVRIGGSPFATGTLGGTHFSVNLTKVRLARSGGVTPMLVTWPFSRRLPEPALARLADSGH